MFVVHQSVGAKAGDTENRGCTLGPFAERLAVPAIVLGKSFHQRHDVVPSPVYAIAVSYCDELSNMFQP